MEPIKVITDRSEILALVGLDLYQSELEEKLKLYKDTSSTRKNWTTQDLDRYIQKKVSTSIVKNEFNTEGVESQALKKKTKEKSRILRKRTDKELIAQIAEEMSFEIMSIKHIYTQLKESMDLGNTKTEAKSFVAAQIYVTIDELDVKIYESESDRDAQGWYKLKLEAMDRLSKIENLEEKGQTNTNIVHGSVNTQNNIDKQIVSGGVDIKDMMNLVRQITQKGQ